MATTPQASQQEIERMRRLQDARRISTPAQPSAEASDMATPAQTSVDVDEQDRSRDLVRARRATPASPSTDTGTDEEREESDTNVLTPRQVAMQMGTAQLLSKSWLLLKPTFGLSALYINLHFVVKYMAGVRGFCHFGDEWMLSTTPPPLAMEKLQEGKNGGALKYGEFVLLVLIDALIVLILIALIAAILFIVDLGPWNIIMGMLIWAD